jgi:arabinogalactan oligomer / maltooligosaccharide transport system permease protein
MTRRPRLWTIVAVHVGLIVLVAVVLYPVLLVCKKAFEPGRNFALSASPLPTELTTDHFKDLFSARGGHGELLFLRHAFNSVIVALATTVVGVVLSCTAAYALSRFRFPGRKAGLTTFLVVQMFPATLLLLPLYVILDKLGLLNSLIGLVLVYSTTAIPFCVWTLKGYFDTLPRELEEAARIDGASPWMIFRKIILPLARPHCGHRAVLVHDRVERVHHGLDVHDRRVQVHAAGAHPIQCGTVLFGLGSLRSGCRRDQHPSDDRVLRAAEVPRRRSHRGRGQRLAAVVRLQAWASWQSPRWRSLPRAVPNTSGPSIRRSSSTCGSRT